MSRRAMRRRDIHARASAWNMFGTDLRPSGFWLPRVAESRTIVFIPFVPREIADQRSGGYGRITQLLVGSNEADAIQGLVRTYNGASPHLDTGMRPNRRYNLRPDQGVHMAACRQ